MTSSFGETTTMAPMVVKNVVIVGDSGGELGVRGHVTASGCENRQNPLARLQQRPGLRSPIGPDFKAFLCQGSGQGSWRQNVDARISGRWAGARSGAGSPTIPSSISSITALEIPASGIPTCGPGTTNGPSRFGRAIPETGQAKWAYQIVPHDAWDYDEIMENILVDMPWQGRMRKLLLHPGRTGFMFVLDRETGEVLSAEKYEPVTWANGYDLKTGPARYRTRTSVPTSGTMPRRFVPSSTGGKEFVPSSFSPRTGFSTSPPITLAWITKAQQ